MGVAAITTGSIDMANVILATKTLQAIDAALEKDQGATFRKWLGRVLPHIGDAYRDEEDGFRTHLGGSLLGRACSRELWYGFRWSRKPKFDGKTLRLFNRGHLEEGRFIALLLMIGCEVIQQDENGNQLRISHAGGHVGGSLDGIVINIPDVPSGMPVLTEFKTHGDKSFQKLVKEGVRSAKFEHFVQMNLYMKKRGLGAALYLAVNKNTDALYGEIVPFVNDTADQFFDRGEQIVFMGVPPKKINESPGWFECTFCDFKAICHGGSAVDMNCRTCQYSTPQSDGTWICEHDSIPYMITKEQQLKGCSNYELMRALQ